MCVLIPASKYPKFGESHVDGSTFLGWVGQLHAYEDKRKKMKVKICGDAGFEHLPVTGASKWAISNLVRL